MTFYLALFIQNDRPEFLKFLFGGRFRRVHQTEADKGGICIPPEAFRDLGITFLQGEPGFFPRCTSQIVSIVIPRTAAVYSFIERGGYIPWRSHAFRRLSI